MDSFDCSGLKLSIPIEGISEFEKSNDVAVNVLGVDVIINVLVVEENKVYHLRRSKYESGKKVVYLLLIAEGEVDEDGKAVDRTHCMAMKNISRLLASSNSKKEHKQHFCMNCLQGFLTEINRDKHQNIVKTMEQ